jgi:hypothetical protein
MLPVTFYYLKHLNTIYFFVNIAFLKRKLKKITLNLQKSGNNGVF